MVDEISKLNGSIFLAAALGIGGFWLVVLGAEQNSPFRIAAGLVSGAAALFVLRYALGLIRSRKDKADQ